MSYRILVTGGAGFIGSHTVDALIERGDRVRIVDNLQQAVHPNGKPEHLHPKAEFVLGDVRERKTWEKTLKGIDAIYHFAAPIQFFFRFFSLLFFFSPRCVVDSV